MKNNSIRIENFNKKSLRFTKFKLKFFKKFLYL